MILRPFGGKLPAIAPSAFVAEGAALVGDVSVGEASSIWFGCVLRGDVMPIRVGARTNVQDGTVVHVTHGRFATHIGDEVTIGHMAMIHACTLEDRSMVGMKACVMDGAVVESEAMVAAGALVTPGKRVRRGQLWGGSPAKHMRDLSPEEIAHIVYLSQHYVDVAVRHRAEGTAG